MVEPRHLTAITPEGIRQPFARYSHGVLTSAGARVLAISGQLGARPNDEVPAEVAAQASICFANIDAILAEAGLQRRHILRLNAYVTDRKHMPGYMHARDVWIEGLTPPPASTLMIVSGFTRPEFKVEIEALAAG